MDNKFDFSSTGKDAEELPSKSDSDDLKAAGFNERFIAYVIDALPFVSLCYWSLSKLISNDFIVFNSRNVLKWQLVWIALYLIYETVFSSGGRATVGKYLMGIRVRDANGSNLSVGKAFLRSVGYFASAIPFNLGYIMAIFTKKKRALHDYMGSSRVISVRERSPMAEGFIIVVAWAALAFFVGSWVNQNFIKLSLAEKKQVVMAKRTLSRIAHLEEIYKKTYGRYTNDFPSLVSLSRNPDIIKRDLLNHIDTNTLMISSNGRDYVISAKAKNWRKSNVKISSLQ